MNPLIAILLLSFIGSIAGLVGGVIFLLKEEWAKILSKYAVPFAAGVLLSVSLLHLLPEAVHLTGKPAYFIVLIALLSSFFFEQYFAHLHHHEGHKHTTTKASAPLVVFGDTIHNFIDGVAIASAYLIDPYFGLVVTLSTFLHEAPHEIGDFGVLMSAGWSRSKTFMANLFSATATFPGALLVFFFLRDAHDKIGILLAFSAGIFLYLGASDFLPEVGREESGSTKWKKFALLVIGVLTMYALSIISPAH